MSRREKQRKRSYKKVLVRPIQDRLGRKSFLPESGSSKAVFLEHEENSGRSVCPAPISNALRSSFCAPKRRSHRSYPPAAHRRSWSVGGSNVHQMMMRRSDSHLRRLKFTADQDQDQLATSRSAFCVPPHCDAAVPKDRILVDAETQTDVRSKGDGFSVDSPAPSLRLNNANTVALASSDSEECENNDNCDQWERKRGRASGSSQRLSLCEPSNHSLPAAGRKYTVDMRQWKYNDSWYKHIQTNSFSPDSPEETAKKSNTLPAQMEMLSLCSSWETCSDSDEEETVPQAMNKGSSSSLRRKSFGRNPIRTRSCRVSNSTNTTNTGMSSSWTEENHRQHYDHDGNVEEDPPSPDAVMDVCGNRIDVSESTDHCFEMRRPSTEQSWA